MNNHRPYIIHIFKYFFFFKKKALTIKKHLKIELLIKLECLTVKKDMS